MERISRKGSGFVKKSKKMFCSNNIYKLSSHLCVKCEDRQEYLKGQFSICNKYYGDG